MSLQSVQQFFADNAPDIDVIELSQSTATVALAAAAHRLDNKKLKDTFGAKARMLSSDEVVTITGHPVGGVCPFGLENPLAVYCDISLKQYAEVLPAAGAIHSAVRISPDRMAELTSAKWVDVCI